MNLKTIRVGIVGLGNNTRLRHVPGLRACEGVEIVAVCNRRPESTVAVAREFGIPQTFGSWQELVAAPDIDAVMIGTAPYLHCPITVAALEAGKHVLTEARMAMSADEASRMCEASRRYPNLVTQIVPSPFGLRANRVVKELLASGYIGELREVVVIGTSDSLANPDAPLQWRQMAELSGVNMLSLGILHETLMRWVPAPIRVFAKSHAFTRERLEPATGIVRSVGTPDSVHVLTDLPGGAQGLYHFSGVTRFGPGSHIHLYGSEGTLKYELLPHDRLIGARRGEMDLHEIEVPPEKVSCWRVEAEFIDAIRGRGKIELTDFATGLSYMQFTEAVAQSAKTGNSISLISLRNTGLN